METGLSTLARPSAVEASPRRTLLDFAAALSASKLDAAAFGFARDACLVTPDATSVHGREAIRAVLAQLILARTELAIDGLNVLIAGEVALVRARWTFRSVGAEGRGYERALEPTAVLRLIEGSWKVAVVDPWGR